MELPKYLNVGGVKYKIDYPYFFKERNDISGQHSSMQTTIKITDIDNNGSLQSRESIRDTFFHELIHAIVWQFYGEKEIDEQLTCALSHGIVQVLKDNDLTMLFDD